MRSSLGGVRRRLEVLDRSIAAACSQPHKVYKSSFVAHADPEPVWPGKGAVSACACGKRIEYTHLINRLHPESMPVARA